MEIQCSFCDQPIRVDASLAGQVFARPHCGQSLQMAAATPVAPVAPSPVASVPVATPVTPVGGATRVEPGAQNPFAIDKDLPSSRRPIDQGQAGLRFRMMFMLMLVILLPLMVFIFYPVAGILLFVAIYGFLQILNAGNSAVKL
tara:strand:- start:1603 stop:2034 length:432 start_codon:yes stop_codon:yes gene_type:complete